MIEAVITIIVVALLFGAAKHETQAAIRTAFHDSADK
jgi:hypothetical protein